ncbi:AraC family transcriptional regulator [Microcoleus sp. herbarium7]|uniref:AraC family transcriptional regulator n=1 Tax=Microcoleus sp. herbarium7 TaxID=3055435 RepID=UPI002FD456BF
MSQQELPQVPEVYSTKDNRVLNLSERSPLLTSNGSEWNDINLAYFDLPAAEMSEYSLDLYGIGINLGQGIELEQVLEGTSHQGFLPTGGSCFCPSYYRQAYRWDRRNQLLYLNLTPELLSRQAIALLKTNCVELIPHFAVQDPLIYQIGLALKAALETDESSDRLYAESAATFLAVHILRHYSTRTQKIQDYVGGLPKHKLRNAIDYIQENLSENISLEAIANHIDISSYHFCRLFKQSTGFSPHQYVIQQRVERAKQLLRQGKMSLSEIAIACGFSHQSHLNRHFKCLTGVTPKIWLKS